MARLKPSEILLEKVESEGVAKFLLTIKRKNFQLGTLTINGDPTASEVAGQEADRTKSVTI